MCVYEQGPTDPSNWQMGQQQLQDKQLLLQHQQKQQQQKLQAAFETLKLQAQQTDRTVFPAAGANCTACSKSSIGGMIGIGIGKQQQQQQQQYPRRQYDKPWRQQQQQQRQEEDASLESELSSLADPVQEDMQEVRMPGCM
jgi:hypothetical protein